MFLAAQKAAVLMESSQLKNSTTVGKKKYHLVSARNEEIVQDVAEPGNYLQQQTKHISE